MAKENKKSAALIICIILLLVTGVAAAGLMPFFTENIYAVRDDIEQLQAEYMAYSGVYYCLRKYLVEKDTLEESWEVSGNTGFTCRAELEGSFLAVESSGYSERGRFRKEAEKKVKYEPILF